MVVPLSFLLFIQLLAVWMEFCQYSQLLFGSLIFSVSLSISFFPFVPLFIFYQIRLLSKWQWDLKLLSSLRRSEVVSLDQLCSEVWEGCGWQFRRGYGHIYSCWLSGLILSLWLHYIYLHQTYSPNLGKEIVQRFQTNSWQFCIDIWGPS